MGSPLRSILEHHVCPSLRPEVLRDPIQYGSRATLKMLRENKNTDYKLTIPLPIKMISCAGFPIPRGAADSLRASVVTILEIEQIDIDESGEELRGLFAVIRVGIPDNRDVHTYISECLKPLLKPRSRLPSDEINIPASILS